MSVPEDVASAPNVPEAEPLSSVLDRDSERAVKRRRLYRIKEKSVDASDDKNTSDDDQEQISAALEPHFEVFWKNGEISDNLYADCAIVLQDEKRGIVRKYSVHKPMLSVKSDYFRRVFDGLASGESDCLTFTELPPYAVDHFDTFLDCIYIKDFFGGNYNGLPCFLREQPLPLGAAETVALMFLTEHFQMPRLLAESTFHAEYTLRSFDNTAMLKMIKEIDNPRLWDLFMEWFPALLEDMYFARRHPQNHIQTFRTMGPEEILKQYKKRGIKEPRLAYMLYLSCDHFDIDANSFLRLTSEELLPHLDKKGVIGLLKHLPKYEQELSKDHQAATALIRLRHRCAEALYEHYVKQGSLSDFESDFNSMVSYGGVSTEAMEAMKLLLKRLCKDAGTDLVETDGHKELQAQIYSVLKQVKMSKASKGVALKVQVGKFEFDDRRSGTYTQREGDSFYTHKYGLMRRRYSTEQNEWIDVRVPLCLRFSKDKNIWEIIESAGVSDEFIHYTNSKESEYKGCPPFEGWKCAKGTGTKLTISF